MQWQRPLMTIAIPLRDAACPQCVQCSSNVSCICSHINREVTEWKVFKKMSWNRLSNMNFNFRDVVIGVNIVFTRETGKQWKHRLELGWNGLRREYYFNLVFGGYTMSRSHDHDKVRGALSVDCPQFVRNCLIIYEAEFNTYL